MKRRSFIQRSSLAAAGTLLIPNFLKGLERGQPGLPSSEKILVVVQLSGGNDGLNTVVPYRNDLYYQLRPQLAISREKVLSASDELGFHPALSKLKDLYDQGYLTVINNVGYPNPDRSHFRSMDIWQTGSASQEYLTTGWVGRYLDSSCQNCDVAYKALELDDSLSLALKGSSIKGLAIKNPEKLYRAMHNDFYKHVSSGEHESLGDAASYLYKTLAESISSADYIYNKSNIYKSTLTYPDQEFGSRMKTIAELITSGLETKVYYVSLSGFDTHVRQHGAHDRLLQLYAESMYAFVQDLEKNNRLGDVIVMTFSEFGRRVAENASGGTDHGTANNLFLIGKNLKHKGFYNSTPDLAQLDRGDLIYQVDFRNVYATLIKNWLGGQEQNVMTGTYEMMDFV